MPGETLAPKFKPVVRVVFSNFNDSAELYLPNPWLSFTLTLEFRAPGAEITDFFFRLTLPGCMYSPYQLGTDEKPGYFKTPVSFHKVGREVSGPRIDPIKIRGIIEQALREQETVKLWTTKATRHYKEMGVNPYDKTQLKKLKTTLRKMRSK